MYIQKREKIKMEHLSIVCLICLNLYTALHGVQGMLDLSVPAYAIEYQGFHINTFKDTSGTSVPTFYYTPACFLLPNNTTLTIKNANPRYLTLKIGLWDEEYTRHIKTYVIRRTGIHDPDIRPVPFRWMRIDSIDTWQLSQFGTNWKPITNHPKVASFRIRCLTRGSCDKIEESLARDAENFASNIHLAFAYHLPNISKSTVKLQRDHVQAARTFRTLNHRFPEADFAYMPETHFDEFVREVMKKSVTSSISHDEFVDDEQIDDLLEEYSRKLYHNITSTTQLTESMWNVTFWTDEKHRPDVKSRHLETLIDNGTNWISRVNKDDNVSRSESSVTVAELRTSKGHEQWNDSDIEPFKLWCVAIGALREKTDFGEFSIWVTKRAGDYATTAHLSSRSSAPQSSNVIEDSGISVSHFNRKFEEVFQMIGNLTDMALRTRCDIVLEPKGRATWLMREADTLGSLYHTLVTVTIRSILDGVPTCKVQELEAATDLFGEVSLYLPKKNGLQLAITFAVAGYYPITVHNVQLDGNLDTFNTSMEPLLFIFTSFTGPGTAAGTLYDFSNGAVLQDVILDFRSDMNNHIGTPVTSITTSENGTWNVTLPLGYYTMTASKAGYITVPYTVVIVGGENKEYRDAGLSPTLGRGEIRIVSLGGKFSAGLFLPVHVLGPVEGTSERVHTYYSNQTTPGSFLRYELFGRKHWEIQNVMIEKQLAGVYRISVSDWQVITPPGSGRNDTLWDMANSCATVQLYTGYILWAQYFMPNRLGTVWNVVEINGSQLKVLNEVTTVTSTEEIYESTTRATFPDSMSLQDRYF